MYRTYPNFIKENRRMSTCNRLNLKTVGSQPIMPKNLPNHCPWGNCQASIPQTTLPPYLTPTPHGLSKCGITSYTAHLLPILQIYSMNSPMLEPPLTHLCHNVLLDGWGMCILRFHLVWFCVRDQSRYVFMSNYILNVSVHNRSLTEIGPPAIGSATWGSQL